MLSFPQTRASLWQIMTSLKHGPYTVCTSHIGSVGVRAIWYIKHIYPCCGIKRSVYGQVWGTSFPQSRTSPWQIMISWQFGPCAVFTSHILGLWVQGLLGTYSPNTPILVNKKCIYGYVSGIPIPVNWRVFQVDVHFVVGIALYYSCH